MDTVYIPLTDYSAKYRVSISTLRRRIKSQTIDFKLESGKYLIADQSPDAIGPNVVTFKKTQEPRWTLPEVDFLDTNLKSAAPASPSHFDQIERIRSEAEISRNQLVSPRQSIELNSQALQSSETDFSTAKLLLTEVKRAYSAVLHEKEDHIIDLKRELADMTTLVRALEKENAKLRAIFEDYRSQYETGLQIKDEL